MAPKRIVTLGERRPFTLGEKSPPQADVTEKLFARLFNTEDGKKVLMTLANETAGTVVPVGSPNEVLQRMEGKRELVADIIARAEKGMRG